MLGLNGMNGNPYQAPPMQYVGMQQGGQQQGKQQQSNPMSTYNNVMKLMGGGTTATGMTPNAVNAYGEPFYGWGAQTGDWGATAAAPASSAELGGASGIADSAGSIGGSGTAEGAGYTTAGYIAAIIAAQHLMSGATDRRTMEGGKQGAELGKGHRTGDVFSGDFFTEPWMAWGEQQLGVDTPTAGEKTDASIDRLREGKGGFSDFASTVPGTAYQWFDPVGNFTGDILGDKFGTAGKVATTILLPHTGLKWGADWLGKLF